MSDVQMAICDGAHFDPTLGYQDEPIVSCPSEPLELRGNSDHERKMNAQKEGWIRRQFRGPKYDDGVRWWSFCPDHVRIAVEQHYLARFSDDGE